MYLWNHPDLQKAFGYTGKYSLIEGRKHFTDFGFNEHREVGKVHWKDPFKCEMDGKTGADTECWCS